MRASVAGCLLFVVAIITGCTTPTPTVGYVEPSISAPGSLMPADAPQQLESLFKTDEAVLSGEEIQRIFATDITVPDDAHVAIIRFGDRRPWFYWSEDMAQLEEQTLDKLKGQIDDAQAISRVTIVPSLLVPGTMTIPHLRVAAARMQADLLLVYRTYVQSYQREKMFQRNQTKARCTVEAILLDTRSGVVLESAIVSRNFTAVEERGDANLYETIGRAEQQATAAALEEIGTTLSAFLDADRATAASD